MSTVTLTEFERPEVEDNDVLLPDGLLGFEGVKKYHLTSKTGVIPFLWFQMTANPGQAFLMLPAATAISNYQPDLDERDVEFLQLEDPADALVLNIVTVKETGRPTVNLKGPVVINRRTRIGKQVIPINAAQFSVSHPLNLS